MGDRQRAYRAFIYKREGKGPLERPRRRWVDNIKWIFSKYDFEEWTELIWFRIGTAKFGLGRLNVQVSRSYNIRHILHDSSGRVIS
jgi:hypothetical protein